MQLRCVLAGTFILTCLHNAACSECPDHATAPGGYTFQDNDGQAGAVQFLSGTDQTVVLVSPGFEIHQQFKDNGQVLLETSVAANGKPISRIINRYANFPSRPETVGQTAEYFVTQQTESPDGKTTATAYMFTKRTAIETESVTIGGCSYDTLVFLDETVQLGEIMKKTVSRNNWSPILGKSIKIEATTYTPPSKDPVVRKWTLVSVGASTRGRRGP